MIDERQHLLSFRCFLRQKNVGKKQLVSFATCWNNFNRRAEHARNQRASVIAYCHLLGQIKDEVVWSQNVARHGIPHAIKNGLENSGWCPDSSWAKRFTTKVLFKDTSMYLASL